jgi:predicted transcriptional regulator
MSKESIGFRIESDRRAALDELAGAMQCDRTTLINEAIEAYLDLHHWQVELISSRLATADAGGEGLEHSEVFSQLRQRLQAKLN